MQVYDSRNCIVARDSRGILEVAYVFVSFFASTFAVALLTAPELKTLSRTKLNFKSPVYPPRGCLPVFRQCLFTLDSILMAS